MAGLRYFRGKNYFTTNHFVFFFYLQCSLCTPITIYNQEKTANWQLTKCELVKFEFCWDFVSFTDSFQLLLEENI